jgi:hypothetical protein
MFRPFNGSSSGVCKTSFSYWTQYELNHVKRPKREADHSWQPGAEVRLGEQRDNFAFFMTPICGFLCPPFILQDNFPNPTPYTYPFRAGLHFVFKLWTRPLPFQLSLRFTSCNPQPTPAPERYCNRLFLWCLLSFLTATIYSFFFFFVIPVLPNSFPMLVDCPCLLQDEKFILSPIQWSLSLGNEKYGCVLINPVFSLGRPTVTAD